MSTAQLVQDQINGVPVRSFIESTAVAGPRCAVESELARLVSVGELVRVRRGLYWKGPKTRIGMPLPRPFDVGMVIAGPAGLTAVNLRA